MSGSVLVLTDGPSLTGEVLSRLLDADFASVSSLEVQSGSSPSALKALLDMDKAGAYQRVVSLAATPGFHTHAFIGTVVSLMAPGGTFTAHEPQAGEGSTEELQKRFLLGGLVEPAPVPSSLPTHFAAAGRKSERQAAARTSLLRRKPKAAGEAAPAPAANGAGLGDVWAVAADEAGAAPASASDDLERVQHPKAGRAPKACPPGGKARKACKNCSCGRADAEARGEPLERPQLTQAMLDNPQSACGSCGLGDKFRCAGCPYAGLPAFKMGQKIELPPNFLVADA